MSKNYTVGSMFAGIGGICLGFKQAGFNIFWANEIDKYACKTYRLNFDDDYLIQGDIQKIDCLSIPKFDVLTAGFPCQTFSSVGLQQEFPESYVLPTENEKQVYKQIGNSVAVPVVFKIAHDIMCALPDNDIKDVSTNEQV